MEKRFYPVAVAALLAAAPVAAQVPGSTALDTAIVRIHDSAVEDASIPSTTGWIGRGFLGGIVLGPIGTGYVLGRASSSAELDAEAAGQASGLAGPDRDIYTRAFRERLRARRQRSALLGGVVGTGVFVYVALQLIDIKHENVEIPPENLILVPLLRFRH